MTPPSLAEAERFLRDAKIEESVLERLAEMLVTQMDDFHLVSDQKTAESVWVVLTEAGRRGKLSEHIGDGDVAIRLGKIFEKLRPRLSAQLQTIRWSYDEIIDFDVKISKNHKSSLHGNSNSHRVGLTLKVLPPGETEVKTLYVDFDEAQLEEFIWKLQEATTMRERIQKALVGGKKKMKSLKK